MQIIDFVGCALSKRDTLFWIFEYSLYLIAVDIFLPTSLFFLSSHLKGSITSIRWIGRVRSNSSLALTTFQSSFLNYSQVIPKQREIQDFNIYSFVVRLLNTIMYRECASSFQVFSENLKNKISLPGSIIMVTADWMRNFSPESSWKRTTISSSISCNSYLNLELRTHE